MRVHRLQVSAFGPFAGVQTLDFDVLNDAGIFLLTGQTGAGKTSVLDAVSFALYGTVPGARNRAKTFKSQHAADEDVPRVELEVTIRDRRFRIARSPAWRRPSDRAKNGFVDEHARILVEERVEDGWVTRATRLDEAGLLIGRVLGMTQEQFCQVVMLPQGQFETFLRADAKERHDLLESLFETSRFRRIEQWLAEERKTRDAAWRQARARIDHLVARGLEVRGPALDEASGVWEEPPADAVLHQLRSWEAELEDLAAKADAVSAARLKSAKVARHAFDEGIRLAELQERHREARRRLGALETEQSAVDARVLQVRRAQSAAVLAPLVGLVDEAEDACADARRRCEVSSAALTGSDGSEHACDEETSVRLASAREQRGRVAALAPVEADVQRLTTALSEHTAALATAEEALAALTERAAAIPQALREARALAEQSSLEAAQVDAAADLLERAEARLGSARAVARLSGQMEIATVEHLTLREARLAAAERVQELRERRLREIAAELASGLEEGHPCPVCGSAAHPHPAATSADPVTAVDEQASSEQLRRAEQALEASAERLSTLRAELATAKHGAARTGVGGATEAVATAGEALARAESARDALPARLAAATALADELDGIEARTVELRTTVAALQAARQEGAATLARYEDQLRPELGQHATVERRLAAVDALVGRLETLGAAEQDLREATRQLCRRRERLARALTDSEFGTAAEVRTAILSKAEVANLDTLNRTHAEELAGLTRLLTDPGLAEAASLAAPDLEALARAAEVADEQRAEAHAEARTLTERRDRAGGLVTELERLLDDVAPLHTALDVASRVTTMVAGTARDNEHKTRLSHYVVAARLEQVVDAANVRLRDIGGGRYQLEHSLSRGAGSSRGGLSLVVLDAYTGHKRDPVTLSGGETFYVSLALALGLADLVRAEAGGAELSTLFVDEGFGGLDAETLDEVMDAIDELRAGGRSVGLVSHLSELRMRIPTQVQVVRGRSGSRIEAAT